MLNNDKLRVIAAWSAILATPLAVAHMVSLASAGDFSNPLALLSSGAAAAQTLRWSMVLDLFGYYLLLVPAILFLWQQLKPTKAYVNLFAISGLLYVLAGAVGAAILAYALPTMMVEYATASATQREVLAESFKNIHYLVDMRLWNTIGAIAGGIWWSGIGWIVREKQPIFGFTTLILGVAALFNGIGNLLGLTMMAFIGLTVYLILATIWTPWIGVLLLNKQRQFITNRINFVHHTA